MTRSKPALASAGLLVLILSAHAATAQEVTTPPAAETADIKEKGGFAFEPLLLDGADNSGSTVGIGFTFKRDFSLAKFDVKEPEDGHVKPSPDRRSLVLNVDSSGVIAADADRNPRNLLDFSTTLSFRYDPGYARHFGRVDLGASLKAETDQTFDDHQVVIGAKAAFGRRGAFLPNDFIFGQVVYGRVQPGEDTVRKAALGGSDLSDYDRVDFEALYIWRPQIRWVSTVELNYRLYQEIDADPAIRAADIDKHELASVRIGFDNALFVAYSVGKLPFDRKDDHALAIGLSYKLF